MGFVLICHGEDSAHASHPERLFCFTVHLVHTYRGNLEQTTHSHTPKQLADTQPGDSVIFRATASWGRVPPPSALLQSVGEEQQRLQQARTLPHPAPCPKAAAGMLRFRQVSEIHIVWLFDVDEDEYV